MAKRPLYKKLKPFLASRFAQDPPQTPSGEVTPELMIAWAFCQVSRHFNKLGAYSVPSSVPAEALSFFDSLERQIDARVAAAMRLKTEYDEIGDGGLHSPVTGQDVAEMFPDVIKPPPPPPPPPEIPPNIP